MGVGPLRQQRDDANQGLGVSHMKIPRASNRCQPGIATTVFLASRAP